MTRGLAAVLFDFAGTLFAPAPAEELIASAAITLGLALSDRERRHLAGQYLAAGLPGGPYPSAVPAHLTSLYALRDLSSDAHRAAYTGLLSTVVQSHPGLPQALYEEIRKPERWVPYADTAQVIACLRDRKISLGVVRNVGFDLRPILRHHGFDELARRCTMSFEEQAVKPDPRIFRAALRALGAETSTTLMVGDHPTIDGGASAIGMSTLILPMTAPGSTHDLSRVLGVLDQAENR